MEKKDKNIVMGFLLFTIFIILIYFGNKLLGYENFMMFIKWYMMLLVSTFIGYPIGSKLFKKFSDRGYIFSKIIGYLIPGVIVFFLCNFKIVKFSTTLCIATFIFSLVCTILYYIFRVLKKNEKEKKDLYENIPKFLGIELLFLFFLIIIAYAKGFNPAAADIEKFMDYGFMKALSISDYLPAKDMWLSGEYINYYYFGHYIATFISKVSQVTVDYGYNLMLITIFVITLFGSYSVASNLLKVLFNANGEKNVRAERAPILGGIIAALSNTIAGNGHFLIYRYIVPFVNKIFNIKSDYIYYYPDSTRYIGENPQTPDKTIHEFPSYSFIISDLHAHLSDLIYVIFAIAVLLSYVLEYAKEKVKKKFEISDALNINVVILGFIIGIMKMTNYWDFPIYLVVSFITFTLVGMRRYKTKKDVILSVIMQMLIIATISVFISLPSTLAFTMISSKIKLAPYHTPLYQLLVLWGIPLMLVIIYFIIHIREHIKNIKEKKTSEKIKWYKKVWMAIYNYFCNMTVADLFVIILAICAFGLLIAPEILYVVDIYDNAPRANTMFKFTYNSYIMFSFCFGYMILYLIIHKKIICKVLGSIILLIFLATCLYTVEPFKSVYGNLLDNTGYEGLDATSFLDTYHIGSYMNYDTYGDRINYDITMEDDLAMINYLRENSDNDDVILEFYGDDFSFDNRISSFTGLQTVLGWTAHEWLWRSVNSSLEYPPMLQERSNDIYNIYTSEDVELKKMLLKKYNIRYIIVGYMERMHINADTLEIPNEKELMSLGEVVFTTNINELEYPAYIIEIK